MKTIKFTFGNIKFLEPIREDWQILLRLESDFKIYVNDMVLFQEVFFNIAEFAVSVSKWLEKAEKSPKDYYFETMDSDEIGLVWFKQKADKWQIGSVYQEFEETHLFEFSELKLSVKDFINELLLNLPLKIRNKVKTILDKK